MTFFQVFNKFVYHCSTLLGEKSDLSDLCQSSDRENKHLSIAVNNVMHTYKLVNRSCCNPLINLPNQKQQDLMP